MDIAALQTRLRQFAAERDWEKFHTPKNLAMALAAESGEVLEVFQWLSPAEAASPTQEVLTRAAEELADVQIYLLRFADKLGIDVERAVLDKIDVNGRRYPASEVWGSASKR